MELRKRSSWQLQSRCRDIEDCSKNLADRKIKRNTQLSLLRQSLVSILVSENAELAGLKREISGMCHICKKCYNSMDNI